MRKREKTIEKRRTPRIKERVVVAVVYRDKNNRETEQTTVSDDLGGGGLRIYLKNDILPESSVNLKFYFFSDPVLIPAGGKVRWTKKVKNTFIAKTFFNNKEKLWWTGIQFVDIDTLTRRRILQWIRKRLAVKIIEAKEKH